MFGELSRKEESNCGLDFSAADGPSLVVFSQPGRLGSNSFEDVVDKGIHDGHGLGGDASVGVDLESTGMLYGDMYGCKA